MDNDIKFNGSSSSLLKKKGGNPQLVPVIGIVKDNIDPTRSGIIRVQLEGSTNPAAGSKDSSGWVKVRYLSTFFGAVTPTAGNTGLGTYKSNPSSYGVWQSPPDIGTEVLCVFANGDINRGFYIGAVPKPESLQMVPAIGTADNVVPNKEEASKLAGATRLPVTNINTNDKQTVYSSDYLDTGRPVHSYTAAIMSQQGVIRDPVRGPISSSASREPASRVGWGVSTPGRPIYEGGYDDTTLPKNLENSKSEQLKVVARRGGHSIVMDDGDIIGRDQLIRIRTSLGHQILMSDDGQTLMILHSNGQSYIELGKEGTVDIFSTNSINMRTQGDFNIHADQHVNIHAMENLNIQAKNMHLNTEEVMKTRVGQDYNIHSLGKFTVKAKSVAMSKPGMLADLEKGIVNAFKLTRPPVNASPIIKSALQPSTTSPAKVPRITAISQTDTLFDDDKGWLAAPEKLLSITTRTPAHAPWANAGQGVEVKVSPKASDNLPVAASSAVQQTNAAADKLGIQSPSIATVATVPDVNAASKSLGASTTNALLSSGASQAAANFSEVVSKGAAAITTQATGSMSQVTVAVGAFAQSATQLEQAGVLKPGASTLVSGLVSAGKSVSESLASSLFTGVSGAENAINLASNVTAQATAAGEVIKKAQSALMTSGVITGKEAANEIAGLVSATATHGIAPVVNTIKQLSTLPTSLPTSISGITSLIGGKAASTVNGVLSTIGAASSAANLLSGISGLGGIANALGGLFGGGGGEPTLTSLIESKKNSAAAAFNSIKQSLTDLTPDVAQQLSAKAKSNATSVAIKSSTVPKTGTNTTATLSTLATTTSSVDNAIDAITGITNSVNVDTTLSAIIEESSSSHAIKQKDAVDNAVNMVSGISGVNSSLLSGGLAQLSSAAKSLQSGQAAINASAIASGINNLPGGFNSIASVIQNNNSLQEVTKLTSLISNTQSNVLNGISNVSGQLSSVAGKLNGITSALSSGLSIGGASKLFSALSAFGGGSPALIKQPTIGTKTYDRTALTNQINKIFNDPGIPMPRVLNQDDEDLNTSSSNLGNIGNLLSGITSAVQQIDDTVMQAKNAYEQAATELPPGDPALVNLENIYKNAVAEAETMLSSNNIV